MEDIKSESMREQPVKENEIQMQITGPVGEQQVRDAYETYKKYRDGLSKFQQRVINAEEWWKNNHWERFEGSWNQDDEIKPVSAWLFNSIINKHADFMDNYPCPAILPREESDEETAKLLSDVVPTILEVNGFDETYNKNCWDKTKIGTAVYAVTWDSSKENGLGDITVSSVDVLNITWQPGIDDIQKSRNIFVTEVVDADTLREQYPQAAEKIKPGNIADRPKYLYEENMDNTDKVIVFDWYYKRVIRNESGSRTVLHYCKFVNDCVLYASENDVRYAEDGWYEHGQYPFVFDVQFPEKGSPAGFGYLDVMVNPQEYIDRLDKVILEHGLMNKPRYFSTNSTNINEEEFTDLSKTIVHVAGNDVSEATIRQIEPPQISDIVYTQRDAKVNELKETSGNRDFSQGSTSSGVTAASAIAALQEAGSKLSRDMIKGTYTAYQNVVRFTVELIRQFYDLPRCYRITKENGVAEYVQMTNEGLKNQVMPGLPGEEFSVRRPVFDIKISAQKASPYSRIAQNELAKELYGLGLFNPQMADQAICVLKMMDFDRKDEVMKMIEQNGTMYQQMQAMQNTMVQMASLIAKTTGDTSILQTLQQQGTQVGQVAPQAGTGKQVETDILGRALNADESTQGKARKRVNDATEVRA